MKSAPWICLSERSSARRSEIPTLQLQSRAEQASKQMKSARLLLDRNGKHVACTVIDPRRASETARSFKPDLLLVDPMMPQEDGIEVAAQFEADWLLHGVPIVLLTSLMTAEEAKDGRRVSGHRILPKPTSGLELIGIIAQNRPCCAEA